MISFLRSLYPFPAYEASLTIFIFPLAYLPNPCYNTFRSFMPVWWNWQTWWTQNPLLATTCRFESGHRHQTHIIRTKSSLWEMGSDYCFIWTMISFRMEQSGDWSLNQEGRRSEKANNQFKRRRHHYDTAAWNIMLLISFLPYFFQALAAASMRQILFVLPRFHNKREW